jgi:hypothetical protein
MEGGLVEETSNLQLSGSHSKTLITDGGLKKKNTQFCKITTPFSSIKGTENRSLEPPSEAHALQCRVMLINPSNDEMYKSPLRRWKAAVQAEAS